MKEFVEKKIKVTSLEIIATGTKEKPYFGIKYKEVDKEDESIGYSSYDLNNVFGWKDECFEIVNQLTEPYREQDKIKCKCNTGYGKCIVDMDAQQTLGGTIVCDMAEDCNFDKKEILNRCEDAEME